LTADHALKGVAIEYRNLFQQLNPLWLGEKSLALNSSNLESPLTFASLGFVKIRGQLYSLG
jgi:hypothetical protein